MKNGPYNMIIAPEGYPGKLYRERYAYEHHVVIWQHTGKTLKMGEEVHHKNGKHRDNRIKNLEIVTAQEHRKLHSATLRQKAQSVWKCFECGMLFSMRGADFRRRTKHQKETARILFCGRSCQVKQQQRQKKIKQGLA